MPSPHLTARHRLVCAGGAALLVVAGSALTAAHAAQSSGPKLTICHATNADTNPYVLNEPDASGDVNGHAGHTGPLWNATLKDEHISWGDIIPPFTETVGDELVSFPGLNWTAAGQAIHANGCSLVVPTPTITPTETPSPTPSVTETVTPTPTPTPTQTVSPTPTITPTESVSPTPVITPTETPSPTPTPTETVSPTPTQTVSPTPTESVLPAEGGVPAVTPTATTAPFAGGAAEEGTADPSVSPADLAFTGSSGNAWLLIAGTSIGLALELARRRRGAGRATR